MYEFLTEGQHMITIRNRDTGRARRVRYWNEDSVHKVLNQQKPNEDVFVTKYPSDRLLQFLILDFDSKDNKELVVEETTRLRNQLVRQGHNVVLVDSTNKGRHVYIQLSPVLFKDNGNYHMNDWGNFFRHFQEYFLRRSKVSDELMEYQTLDPINSRAGLNANIRIIGSIHPVTGRCVEIIDGSFKEIQPPTHFQDKCLRIVYQLDEIIAERENYRKQNLKTTVVNGNDPIENNDLREILPAITGNPLKMYSRGYGFMKCPFHNDNNPSLLVTKEYYSCASCNAKGNIWTLKKQNLVEFDNQGVVHV